MVQDGGNVGKQALTELNHINVRIKISNRYVTKPFSEHEGIRAVSARQHIARTANEDILAVAAKKLLLSETAVEDLLSSSACQDISRRAKHVAVLRQGHRKRRLRGDMIIADHILELILGQSLRRDSLIGRIRKAAIRMDRQGAIGPFHLRVSSRSDCHCRVLKPDTRYTEFVVRIRVMRCSPIASLAARTSLPPRRLPKLSVPTALPCCDSISPG